MKKFSFFISVSIVHEQLVEFFCPNTAILACERLRFVGMFGRFVAFAAASASYALGIGRSFDKVGFLLDDPGMIQCI